MLNNLSWCVFSGVTMLSTLFTPFNSSVTPVLNSSASICEISKIEPYVLARTSQYSINCLLQEQEQKDKIKNTVKSFSSLPNNWNSYGAMPISQDVIERALRLLEVFSCKMEVFPTGRNSIQFELLNSQEEYFEIEIFSDRIDIYEELKDSEVEKTDVSDAELGRLVGEFYARISH